MALSIMIFPENYASLVIRHAKRFTFGNVSALPTARGGVYLFSHKRTFVYIGKSAKGLGVRERLLIHYGGTHNDGLDTWLRALDGDVSFSYVTCQDCELDDLERSLIIFLQPRTNQVLYRNYTPNRKTWRKYYG